MGPIPLPPHERTWRHPSELAADERAFVRAEPVAASTRSLALATGSIGLLAIGVLVITVTPRRQESPLTIIATTTPLAVAAVTSVASTVTTTFAPTTISRPIGFAERELPPLATPIGDGQFALVTETGLADQRGPVIDVRFVSGELGTGAIVSGPDQPVVVVSLANEVVGHKVAHRLPQPNEMVTVMASPPFAIRFADIGTLDVAEGTAVIDSDGSLVGLFSHERDGGAMILVPVSDELVDATNDGR